MAIQRKRIRALVHDLLASSAVTRAPVPVRKIARSQGARIVLKSLEGDLSGFLYRDENQATIGVNTHHAPVRQDFTIAHELGHLLLHDQQDPLHVDHKFSARLRSDVSSQGTDEGEMEANHFAAELLMPHEFIAADLAQVHAVDLCDEELLPALARKYCVSVQALQYRLMNLGFIKS